MSNISFSEWYTQLQELIELWKELSSNQNWLETHKEELTRHGLNPSKLNESTQNDINILTHQILHFDKEKM